METAYLPSGTTLPLLETEDDDRDLVDVSVLFDEVAAELGLQRYPATDQPSGRSIEFGEVRLHDQPVDFGRISDDIRKVTEMQQHLTPSSERRPPPLSTPGAEIITPVGEGADDEIRRNMIALFRPEERQKRGMRTVVLIVMSLFIATVVYVAYMYDVLNPLLPESVRHVKPSVEEYIHGRAK